MDDLRSRQPAVGVERHFAPCETPLMAATAETAIPTLSHFPTEVLQRPQVAVDRMGCETAPQDALEPPALLGNGQLSSIP